MCFMVVVVVAVVNSTKGDTYLTVFLCINPRGGVPEDFTSTREYLVSPQIVKFVHGARQGNK